MKRFLAILLFLIELGFAETGFAENLSPADFQLQDQQSNQTQPFQQNISSSQSPLQGRAVLVDINSSKLEYFQDKNEFVATGAAEVMIPEQNSRLEADKIIYNQDSQIVIAEGNVKITKNGKIIYGDYAKIDLTKESALINDSSTVINEVKMVAKTANVYTKDMEAFKGRAIIDNKILNKMKMSSVSEFSGDIPENNLESSAPASNSRPTNAEMNAKSNYKIITREITITSKPDLNIIALKGASIYLGKFKVAYIPYMELSADKKSSRIETMLPEIGHNQQLGTYFGPSHVFYLPHGSTLKVSPLLALDGFSSFGGGGIIRFNSETNKTELGYSTVKNKFIAKGEQEIFSPDTKILYGSNSYMNNGIFGYNMPKYILEIADDRKIGSAFNFDFFNRTSTGYAEDYGRNFGTARLQLQGNIINAKPLFDLGNGLLRGRIQSQYDLSLYGTGDSFGLIRLGPSLSSKLGRLSLGSTYFQSAMRGRTPFLFDRYVYGKSNLILAASYKLTKNLDIGTYRSLNLTKDNWNRKLVTENVLYARVGPEDLKFRIGYDFERKCSTVGLDLLMGSGKTALDFDKMKYNDLSSK